MSTDILKLEERIAKLSGGFAVFNRKGESPEIFLYGVIGDKEDGLTAKQFVSELEQVKSAPEITIRINSPGGFTGDGLGIYNALQRFPGKKVVEIDGIALSAASFIALAGSEVRMAENALWMMHNAWDVEAGDAETLRKKANQLDQWTRMIADIYAKRSKIQPQTILNMMAAETWLDSGQAKAQGFVDVVSSGVKVAAKFDPAKFKNVPEKAFALAGIQRPIRQRAAIETEQMRQIVETLDKRRAS